ncbi:MAG: CpaF family protein, partial [Nocardioides sp.]
RRIRSADAGQRRIVESIREVAGRDEDGVKTTELWKFNKATGRTEFTRKAIIREEALLEVGWDPDGTADLRRFAEPTGTDGDEGWQI